MIQTMKLVQYEIYLFIYSIQFNSISVDIYHRIQCNIHIYIYNRNIFVGNNRIKLN